MFENYTEYQELRLRREEVLALLKKQCFCFSNGKKIFKSAVEQINEEKMGYLLGCSKQWYEWQKHSFINSLLFWSQTKERSSYWSSINGKLYKLIYEFRSTLKLPDKTKEKFIEINDG